MRLLRATQKINMVKIRKVTGKEDTDFWQERYGKKAGEAPMVSRIHGQGSFASQGAAGYTITDSSSHGSNNILVHSIRAMNTQDDTDNAVIELFENNIETTVASAYSDGGTSLILTDASSFATSGSGYIDGDPLKAFSWTNKSSNTLTVPDLNADFSAGTRVINASGVAQAQKKLRILVNAQLRKNSVVTINFPIPMLLINGGRVFRGDGATSGPLVSICYTVLQSKGDIDPHKDIFLQSHCQTTNSAEATIVSDSDIEVYGCFINTTADNENDGNAYSQCNIRNGDGNGRAYVYVNETFTQESGDYEIGAQDGTYWFPYPIYCKDGLKLENTGASDGEDETYSTVFYRKVKSKGVSYGWT